MSTNDLIRKALGNVIDPELHKPLPELGMVESVDFSAGVAKIGILLTIVGCPMKDRLKADITKALSEIEEVKSIEVIFGVMNEEQRNNVKSKYSNENFEDRSGERFHVNSNWTWVSRS